MICKSPLLINDKISFFVLGAFIVLQYLQIGNIFYFSLYSENIINKSPLILVIFFSTTMLVTVFTQV